MLNVVTNKQWRAKKALVFFATAFALVTICSPAATVLSLGSAPSYPSQTVTVPVTLSRSTNVVAVQLDVAFNSSKVTSQNPSLGSGLTNYVIRSRLTSSGVRRVLVYSPGNKVVPSTNALLANLPFTVATNVFSSSGPLAPTNAILASANASSVTLFDLVSGTIFISPLIIQPDGTARFFFPSTPDAGYIIQATTNFTQWVNISTNTAASEFLEIADADAKLFPYRFYRYLALDAFGQLGQAQVSPEGQLLFDLTGLTARSYTLQASSNLLSWEDLTTVIPSQRITSVTNTVNPLFPKRFYRLKSSPP